MKTPAGGAGLAGGVPAPFSTDTVAEADRVVWPAESVTIVANTTS